MPPPNPLANEAAAAFMRRVARIEIERCGHCQGRWHMSLMNILLFAFPAIATFLPRSMWEQDDLLFA